MFLLNQNNHNNTLHKIIYTQKPFPKDITFLHNNKLLLLFQKQYIIISINEQTHLSNQHYKFQQKYSSILPLGEQSFIFDTNYQNNITIVDENKKVKIINIKSNQYNHNKLCFFSSGLVFVRNQKNQTYNLTKELKLQTNEILYHKADDKCLAFFSVNQKQFTLFNLETQEKIIYKFPSCFGFYQYQEARIFMIDQISSILLCKGSKQIEIVMIDYDKQQWQRVFMFDGMYDKLEICGVNRQQNIVLICLEIISEILFENQIHLFLFDYKNKEIVIDIDGKGFGEEKMKRFNKNLKSFVRIDEEKGVIFEKIVRSKKGLYIHMIKKSVLENKYGTLLAEKVIKILE